jgi:hypothetical protein
MAPEQVTAKNVDARADIYSLGIVLYEMVTGRKPFMADTPLAVMFKHASDPLPRPSQFAPNLPDAAEKVLVKALAKKPDNRYQTMGEFAAAMEKTVSSDQMAVTGKKGKSEKVVAKSRDLEKTADLSVPAKPVRPVGPGRPAQPLRRWISIAILVAILGITITLGIGLLNLGIKGMGPLAGLATHTDTPTFTPTFTPTNTPTPIPALLSSSADGAFVATWNGSVGQLIHTKCGMCHGANSATGLSMDTYANIMKGGKNGPVIVAGNADTSKLIQVQFAGGHPGQLSADEFANVKAWIEKGAPDE